MPSFDDEAGPATVTWAVVRATTTGDYPVKTLQFFDAYYGDDDPRNVLSDLSESTWASSVAPGRFVDPLFAVDVVVDLDTAEVTPTMTNTQARLLTNSTYIWDLVEDPGLPTELTIITGRMTVSGRATS